VCVHEFSACAYHVLSRKAAVILDNENKKYYPGQAMKPAVMKKLFLINNPGAYWKFIRI
jgi:hypothetical protein